MEYKFTSTCRLGSETSLEASRIEDMFFEQCEKVKQLEAIIEAYRESHNPKIKVPKQTPNTINVLEFI